LRYENETRANKCIPLIVDTSSTNIAIRQILLNGGAKGECILSYIAFKNRETGKLDHLFECEEGSGTLLYDAVTGETAELLNVSSISALRSTSANKEWISSNEDLINEIDYSVDPINALCRLYDFNYLDYPITIDFKIKNFWKDGQLMGYSDPRLFNRFPITFIFEQSILRCILFKSFTGTSEDMYMGVRDISLNTTSTTYAPVNYRDGKWHRVTLVVSNRTKTVSFYWDGVLVQSKSVPNMVDSFKLTDTNTCEFGPQTNYTPLVSNITYGENGKVSVSDIRVFNVELLDESVDPTIANDGIDVGYTLNDLFADKDIPLNLRSLDGHYVNKLHSFSHSSKVADGTVTVDDETGIATYDNYTEEQFGLYAKSSLENYISNTLLPRTPGSWTYSKWKFNMKHTDLTGNNGTGGSITYRFTINGPVDNLNNPTYYQIQAYKYRVTNEAGDILTSGEKTFEYNKCNQLGIPARYVYNEAQETRYVEVWLKMCERPFKDNITTIHQHNFNSQLMWIYNTNARNYSITGNVQLLKTKTYGTNLIIENINQCGIIDGSANLHHSKDNNKNGYCRNKNYGTWANNVGFTQTEDGVIIPRKILG
jgi:hypothetical protein